MQISFTIDII